MSHDYNPFADLSAKQERILSKLEQLEQQFVKLAADRNAEAKFITKKQVAKLASVSTSTIESWKRKGYIQGYYPGEGKRALRFDKNEVIEFLKSR